MIKGIKWYSVAKRAQAETHWRGSHKSANKSTRGWHRLAGSQGGPIKGEESASNWLVWPDK